MASSTSLRTRPAGHFVDRHVGVSAVAALMVLLALGILIGVAIGFGLVELLGFTGLPLPGR